MGGVGCEGCSPSRTVFLHLLGVMMMLIDVVVEEGSRSGTRRSKSHGKPAKSRVAALGDFLPSACWIRNSFRAIKHTVDSHELHSPKR